MRVIRILFLLTTLIISNSCDSDEPSILDTYQTTVLASNFEQIRTNLLNNPPNEGDPMIRKRTILKLDNILKQGHYINTHVRKFYGHMMNKVHQELKDSLSAITIWMMYNHGFLIKTNHVLFAFDLVAGCSNWQYSVFPVGIIDQLDILFISHEHKDHYDAGISSRVKTNGGYVIVPSEESWIGNTAVSPNDTLTLMGLKIKAHYGKHSVATRIYEVITPCGLKIVHTGDNQKEAVPNIHDIDILLINAWIGADGMHNYIWQFQPDIMFPAHFHELDHALEDRIPYEWAYEINDVPLGSKVLVMAWGERYVVPDF
jgi:L-ascorbate metabolism protein UlaG (beta-lactamase superfamily)